MKRKVKKAEVAIIGSGPAGLAAASEAVAYGLSVTLFDDNSLPGGQYLRQMPGSFQKVAPTVFDRHKAHHASFLKLTNHPNVQYMSDTIVWGVFSDKIIAYASGIESGYISADYIIIATGALDRAVPFPGWTLPGVIAAGGVLNLIKGQRIVPGGRVLIAGNGPLILLVAYNLHRAGCEYVTAGEIYDKIHGSIYDINSIKTLTRTGMGRCQGRNCLGTLAEIVHAETKCELSDGAFPRVRPPVKPISIVGVITGERDD